MNRHLPRKPVCHTLKPLHRRPLRHRAGEWVNHRETARCRGTIQNREPGRRYATYAARLIVVKIDGVHPAIGQRRQEMKNQTQLPRQRLEFGPIGPIPGNNRIEAAQPLDHILIIQQAQTIQPGCHNRPRTIGKARQTHVGSGAPNLRIIRAQRLERRQAYNEVADGSRPY